MAAQGTKKGAKDKGQKNRRGKPSQSKAAQDRQPRSEQTNDPYGAKRSNFDLSLKVATLGRVFSSCGKGFQHLGAMLFIDLQPERSTKKLLLAPLVW